MVGTILPNKTIIKTNIWERREKVTVFCVFLDILNMETVHDSGQMLKFFKLFCISVLVAPPWRLWKDIVREIGRGCVRVQFEGPKYVTTKR